MRVTAEAPTKSLLLDSAASSLLVSDRVVLRIDNSILAYETAPVAVPYIKQYPIRNPAEVKRDLIHFVARDRETTLGIAQLSMHWNGCAAIQHIAVFPSARRRGIGGALLAAAQAYIRQNNIPGIVAETQDNNVPACSLYQRAGFTLSGFDSQLYRTVNVVPPEVALFWYWFFSRSQGAA